MAGRPKGTPKTGGRVAGTANKRTAKIDELVKDKGDPVKFLLNAMNDPLESMSIRVDCAKAVAPYTNSKKPTASIIAQVDSLKQLSDAEIEKELEDLRGE